MNKTWFYLVRGKPVGPIAEDELTSLRRDGAIDDETLVWSQEDGPAPHAWRPYSALGLRSPQEPGGKAMPPPAPASEIIDLYLWLIVLAPIGLALLDLILFVGSGGSHATAIVISASLATYCGLAALDTREIERSGHLAKAKKLSVWWIVLVPVYLWKRATLLKRGRGSVWIWLALVLVSAIVVDEDFAVGVMAGAGILPDCDSELFRDRVKDYFEDLIGVHGLIAVDVTIIRATRESIDPSILEKCNIRVSLSNHSEEDVDVSVMRGANGFNFDFGQIKDVQR